MIDPTSDPNWHADYVTRNQDEFLRVYWQSVSCAAFFDEGSRSVGKYNLATEDTATLGRHRGHINHYIMQRIVQVPPIVRDQCTELFLFRSSRKDGVTLAEEWAIPELEQCAELPLLHYFHATRDGTVLRKTLIKGDANASRNSDSRSGNSSDRTANARRKTSDEQSGKDSRGVEAGEESGEESSDG